jgi:hypothetical protein
MNSFARAVVYTDTSMGRGRGPSLPSRLLIVALMALTLFVSAVRPLVRTSALLSGRLGLTRWSLLCEPAVEDDHDAPLASPVIVDTGALAFLLIGVVPLLLKSRRSAFRAVPVCRLKLPPRRSTDPSSSH